ncbi:MAG: hypothetical protein AB1505_15210 [Candidatus Latescibacterota bacterium]
MDNQVVPERGGAAPSGDGELTQEQRESFDTLRSVLRIQINGDWDEPMINAAFDRLERLIFGSSEDAEPAAAEETRQRPRSRPGVPRRRGRRG